MKNYIEYEIEEGKSVVIEIEETDEELVPASLGDKIAKAQQNFDQALETIGPIAGKLLTHLKEIPKTPDQIAIEFGLKLGFNAGVVIASGSSEANFKVSLTWKKDNQSK
jgi:hypothetical protein